MNQDFTFEDAFKMENLMESLKEREDRYIVKRTRPSRGSNRSHLSERLVLDKSTNDAPAIIGIREHVFTGSTVIMRGRGVVGSLYSAYQALRTKLG